MTDNTDLRSIRPKIIRLASEIIWGLSIVQSRRHQNDDLNKRLEAIAWFSGIVVDDWPDPNINLFLEELTKYNIYIYLVNTGFEYSYREFIDLINLDKKKIPQSLFDIKGNFHAMHPTIDHYILYGLENNYITPSRGFLHKLAGSKYTLCVQNRKVG